MVDVARIERRSVNRLVAVQQFLEKPNREIRHDERGVDDRETAGRNSVGVRDHPGTVLLIHALVMSTLWLSVPVLA
jgi:hypothetical protein